MKMFRPRFEEAIAAGVKCATIRKMPARVVDIPNPGVMWSLRVWTGAPYRSKQREAGQGVVIGVASILVMEDGFSYVGGIMRRIPSDLVDVEFPQTCEELAKIEGFADWADLRGHFREHSGLPFTGIISIWKPAKGDAR